MESVHGQIIAIDGASATVQVDAVSGCARCAAGRGCGAALLQRQTRSLVIRLPAHHGYAVGDPVLLTIGAAELLRAALLAYGFPLAGILAGLVLAALVTGGPGDLGGVLFATAGLLAGLLLGRRRLDSRGGRGQFVPRIAGVVHGGR